MSGDDELETVRDRAAGAEQDLIRERARRRAADRRVEGLRTQIRRAAGTLKNLGLSLQSAAEAMRLVARECDLAAEESEPHSGAAGPRHSPDDREDDR